jgi:hypothetical protein
VYGISIYPEDGTVDAAASDFDGYELTLPKEATQLDSPTVIKDDVFEDQNSMDEVPDDKPPAPVKVMLPRRAGGRGSAKPHAAGVGDSSMMTNVPTAVSKVHA